VTRTTIDLREIRRNAIEARDGAMIGGIRAEPHTFCTVHWQIMLALCDATDQPRLTGAHLTVQAERTAAELNHAIAHNHERSEILRLLGQLMRQLHGLTERNQT
jgi:hypothetical protein